MEKRNHEYMAHRIFEAMQENGMVLNRKYFMFGSIAPDTTYSFVLRRHQHNTSSRLLRRKIRRLYNWVLTPQSRLFSYKLGVITHYVCDYFCYAHSRVFKGTLRDHIEYEKLQQPLKETAYQDSVHNNPLPSISTSVSNEKLVNQLDEFVYAWERLQEDKTPNPGIDIQMAIHVGVWLACSIYLSAVKSVPRVIESREIELETLVEMPVYAYQD